MSKVCYLGVYRDGTGWAQAAIDYILALDAAGVDVVCRPIRLNHSKSVVPQRIYDLESKSLTDCRVVIQHILPHMMDYNGRLKNIGMFASETSNFRHTNWKRKLNTMDEIVVFCGQQVEACFESKVNRPIHVIPHACDVGKFQKHYQPLKLPFSKNDFVFYFIGEFNRRKNLAALLKAFHTTFRPSEPVQLVIKSSVPGRSAAESHEIIHSFCEQIKKDLKIYRSPSKYKAEVINTRRFDDEEILRLHASCNCFVMPSRGEAWCIPAFDALGMGRPVIATNTGGMADYLSGGNGWLIPFQSEPCFGMQDTLPDLYTADETWAEISIPALSDAMREAFEMPKLYQEKATNAANSVYDYSHLSIGTQMREVLNLD